MIDNNTSKTCNYLLQSNRAKIWSPSMRPHQIGDVFHVLTKKGVFKEFTLVLQGCNLYKGRQHKWKVCDISNSHLSTLKHNIFGEGVRLAFTHQKIDIFGPVKSFMELLKKQCIQSNFTQQFSILKLIGQGTYGKVYRVKHKGTQKEFAVKTFEKSLLVLASDKLSLTKELEIARLMEHPSVMRMFETHESEQFIFVVFELISGGTLRQEIKKGKLSEKRAFTITRQMLVAIEHMHSQGVFHRDIKPENVMFRNPDEIVLTDFGLADFYRKDGSYLFTSCGTPGYCAPELLLNKAYDLKVDIYSVGIVLYQMLCGQIPFNSDDYNIRVKLNKQGLIDWSIVPVQGDALDLLQSLLARIPQHRYSASQALNHKYFGEHRSGISHTLVSTGSHLSSPKQMHLLSPMASPLGSPKINSLHQMELDVLDNLMLEQTRKEKSTIDFIDRRKQQQGIKQKIQHRSSKSEVLLFFQE